MDSQVILKKGQYWLELAEKHRYRGERYQELCDYKMAASYFFELKDKEQLRQIFKRRPDVKSLLDPKIVEFAMSISQTNLTVAEIIEALKLCDPMDKVKFLASNGEELLIAFIETSCQRDTVYLHSCVPDLSNGDGTSKTMISSEIPYLGDTVKCEDEINE